MTVSTTAVVLVGTPRQHGPSDRIAAAAAALGAFAELLSTLHRYVCPECQQGKHQNCDGRGGFDEDDLPVPCACYVDGHPA